MVIIWGIIIGALIGWFGSILTGRTERYGCLSNVIAGEVGGLVGALLGSLIFGNALVLAAMLAIGAVALGNKLFAS